MNVTVGEDELIFKKVGPIDFTKGVKIPTYKWCCERYFTILNDLPKNLNGRKNDALNRVAKELTEVYLYADLCPTSENTMRERLQKRIKQLSDIRSELNRKNIRKSATFFAKTKSFLKDLNWGINIFNPDRQDYLGIKVGDDEFKLYKDHCVPEIVDGKEIIKYQAMAEGTMHPSTKMAIKRLTKLHSLDNYYEKLKGKLWNQMR